MMSFSPYPFVLPINEETNRGRATSKSPRTSARGLVLIIFTLGCSQGQLFRQLVEISQKSKSNLALSNRSEIAGVETEISFFFSSSGSVFLQKMLTLQTIFLYSLARLTPYLYLAIFPG
ncbi:MAG: hypothetical protein HC862_14160 [Scytonema sp. RU_4_4]|nr:hypothetical protein [Scytonema sp. RU_4_4]NJR75933.1 hypothetical protein [Scytonema sp. CRU_2_7]